MILQLLPLPCPGFKGTYREAIEAAAKGRIRATRALNRQGIKVTPEGKTMPRSAHCKTSFVLTFAPMRVALPTPSPVKAHWVHEDAPILCHTM